MQAFYAGLDQFLVATGLEASTTGLGCSEVEVAAQKQAYGVQFPLAYRLFLKWCGRATLKSLEQDFQLAYLDSRAGAVWAVLHYAELPVPDLRPTCGKATPPLKTETGAFTFKLPKLPLEKHPSLTDKKLFGLFIHWHLLTLDMQLRYCLTGQVARRLLFPEQLIVDHLL